MSLLERHFQARGKALFSSAPADLGDNYEHYISDEDKLVAITEFKLKAPKNQGVGIFIRSAIKSGISVSIKKMEKLLNLIHYFMSINQIITWYGLTMIVMMR